MKCEDCGGAMTGTPAEFDALLAGVRICQSCQESMVEEAGAYEQIMRDEGYECVFDLEKGFRTRRIDQSDVPSTPQLAGGED